MSSAADPLADALRDWRAARTVQRATTSGSPEWEEATILADEAGWRYHGHLADRKERVSVASRGVLAALDEIKTLHERRDATDPSSNEHAVLLIRIRDAARQLLVLADAEEQQGHGIPPTGESIETVERDGPRRS
jgi:hypothetical protein